MPYRSHEELVHETVTLHRAGLSRRAIARTLGISRNTVRKLLRGHAEAREAPHTAFPKASTRAPRVRKTDAYDEHVKQLLEKYTNITAQRVFEILRGRGYDGGYTAVKEQVRRLRPKPKPKPSLQTPDWGPGQMAESDWSPYELTLVGGRQLKVQLFSYVLVHSKRIFYQAFGSYDVHALMAGHIQAFERFGGVAARCKYDGQAAVARWEGGQPIYNPQFLAFCAHYEMRPWAMRGNPNLRPNVERGFWTHERSFLVARDFVDLDDFRAQLRAWLDETVDHRTRHGTTPLQRFATEAEHLIALPRHPYDTARVLYRICSIDGFVEYEGNSYAVPYDHVTDILPVRVTQRELFVYATDFSCIARHELVERGAHRRVDPSGLHKRSTRRASIDLDQVRATYEDIGAGAGQFIQMLSDGPARTWGAAARRILTLRERYATEHLDTALGHAARYGVLSFKGVQRVLEARHSPRRLDEWVTQETAERLADKVGHRTTVRSDLTEYNRLAQQHTQENRDDTDSDNSHTRTNGESSQSR